MRTSPKPRFLAFIFLLVVGIALTSTCVALYNLEAASERTSFFLIGVVGLGLAVVSGWLFYAHRLAQARLDEVTALQAGILHSANIAVISVDSAGIVRSFNPTAERWLGWRADELVGLKTPVLFHDSAEIEGYARELSTALGLKIKPDFNVLVGKVRAGLSTVDEREWTYVRKDGSRFPVWLSVTAMRNKRGQITGYFGVAS